MKRAPEQLRFAAMAVDAVVFSIIDEKLVVLVAPVGAQSAYKGMEAFLGGLIKETENADEALMRVLKEKGDLSPTYAEQLYTFSDVDRDKRNRVVAVAYVAFVSPDKVATYEHENAHFVPVRELPKLAYDHDQILKVALKRLRGKISYTTIAQFLLPRHFTLSEFQNVYELILGQELDKRNFRKKILALNIIKETGRMEEGVKHRPAALYQFTSQKLVELPLIA